MGYAYAVHPVHLRQEVPREESQALFVAIGTLPWCSFIGDQQLTGDYMAFVTETARDIDMRAVQFEGRLLVVIEFRRTPVAVRMAFAASDAVACGFELTLMNVFMAAFALPRGGCQIHGDNAALRLLFVTALAPQGRVTTFQWKFCFGVVKK